MAPLNVLAAMVVEHHRHLEQLGGLGKNHGVIDDQEPRVRLDAKPHLRLIVDQREHALVGSQQAVNSSVGRCIHGSLLVREIQIARVRPRKRRSAPCWFRSVNQQFDNWRSHACIMICFFRVPFNSARWEAYGKAGATSRASAWIASKPIAAG
jgi:hypothetical protein